MAGKDEAAATAKAKIDALKTWIEGRKAEGLWTRDLIRGGVGIAVTVAVVGGLYALVSGIDTSMPVPLAVPGQTAAQQSAVQQQVQATERWYKLGRGWNPVRTQLPAAASALVYGLDLGPTQQPVRVPAPPAAVTLTTDAARTASGPVAGAFKGVLCFNDDRSLCVTTFQSPKGASGHALIGNPGGLGWMPLATNTPRAADGAAEFGPLVVDPATYGAVFREPFLGASDLISRQDLSVWLLMLAESNPTMAKRLTAIPGRMVSIKPFSWISGPGYQAAQITFVVGEQQRGDTVQNGVQATAQITVEALGDAYGGLVRATASGFSIK